MTASIPIKNPPQVFAAWNNDEDIRSDSSSGGVFNALMHNTFLQNGVVYGAVFDKSMTLVHQMLRMNRLGTDSEAQSIFKVLSEKHINQFRINWQMGKKFYFQELHVRLQVSMLFWVRIMKTF